MLTSLALIFLVGLAMASICQKIKLPRIIGMLITGIILGTAFLLIALEEWLKNIISISGLLAVMSMACMLQLKSVASVSARLSEKFGKLWIAAEVILFVLVGAAVDIRYTLKAGLGAVF